MSLSFPLFPHFQQAFPLQAKGDQFPFRKPATSAIAASAGAPKKTAVATKTPVKQSPTAGVAKVAPAKTEEQKKEGEVTKKKVEGREKSVEESREKSRTRETSSSRDSKGGGRRSMGPSHASRPFTGPRFRRDGRGGGGRGFVPRYPNARFPPQRIAPPYPHRGGGMTRHPGMAIGRRYTTAGRMPRPNAIPRHPDPRREMVRIQKSMIRLESVTLGCFR